MRTQELTASAGGAVVAREIRSGLSMILIAACSGLVACEPAVTTIRVLPTGDGEAESLRAAINRVNSETGTTFRIELMTGTHALTRCALSTEDANDTGDLDLTTPASVTLVGVGPDVIVTQSCVGERVLDSYGSGKLTVAALTVTGGSLAGALGKDVEGGGIRTSGDLTLEGAALRNNLAKGAQGSIATAGNVATAGGRARGGGAFVGGTLVATDTVFESNEVIGGAGMDPVGASDARVAAGSAEGGGVYVTRGTALAGGRFSGNSARAGDGGIGGNARGGGLAQAASADAASGEGILVNGTEFTQNVARGGTSNSFENQGTASGGALVGRGNVLATNVRVTENMAHAPSGIGRGGAFASRDLTVSNSQFSSNSLTPRLVSFANVVVPPQAPTLLGGALAAEVVALTDVELDGNVADNGGALTATTLTANRVTASENRAHTCGGGAFVSGNAQVHDSEFSRNTAVACGGGIYADVLVTSKTLILENLLLGGATEIAPFPPTLPIVPEVVGAGIFARRLIGKQITVARNKIDRCFTLVIRGPSLPVNAHGGGIGADTAELVNATVDGNQGPNGGCNIDLSQLQTLPPLGLGIDANTLSIDHLTSTDNIAAGHLVSHRSALLGGFGNARVERLGSWIPRSPSVIDESSNSFFTYVPSGTTLGTGDVLVEAAPPLAPLADTGGNILTRSPLAGSALIDHIPTAACPVTLDARGVGRPQGSACDVGAVEMVAP